MVNSPFVIFYFHKKFNTRLIEEPLLLWKHTCSICTHVQSVKPKSINTNYLLILLWFFWPCVERGKQITPYNPFRVLKLTNKVLKYVYKVWDKHFAPRTSFFNYMLFRANEVKYHRPSISKYCLHNGLIVTFVKNMIQLI